MPTDTDLVHLPTAVERRIRLRRSERARPRSMPGLTITDRPL